MVQSISVKVLEL